MNYIVGFSFGTVSISKIDLNFFQVSEDFRSTIFGAMVFPTKFDNQKESIGIETTVLVLRIKYLVLALVLKNL